jgi:fatty acid desaturase
MSALAPSTVFGVIAAPRVRRGGSVGLLVVAVSLFVVSALALPFALHLLVGAGALVVAMVVAHDAIHSAAHRDVKVNRAIGWLASLACGVPFSMLASNHLRHHRLVDTDEDPERFCLGPAWQLPVRGAAMLGFYYVETWPRLDARARRSVVLFVLVEVLALVLAPSLLVTWVAPLLLAAVLFATFTVWLPHGPYGDLVMRVAPFLTGYHDDHHARPAVPSLQYGELHRWHVETGVVTRKALAKRSPVAVGEALAVELVARSTGRAVQVEAAFQAATVELLGLGPTQALSLGLARRGWAANAGSAAGLDLLLAATVRQLSLHPRARARVEAGLASGSTAALTAAVLEAARLERGEGPAAFDPTRQVAVAVTGVPAVAVGVLSGLLARARLDVRVGSPVKPRAGLEVRVLRRAVA